MFRRYSPTEVRCKMSGVKGSSVGKSPIEEFLEKARGFWLRAEHVQPGDRVLILDEPVVDETTFDR